MDNVLELAAAKFPHCATAIQQIRAVRQEVHDLPFEEFFEPKSAFDLSGKSPRLIALSLLEVVAFSRHVAYASRTRMSALEQVIVESMLADRFTAAMVLLRSHAETAGVAALAVMTLRDGTAKKLNEVVQKTLFGSSIAKGWSNLAGLKDYVSLNESQPLGAGELMDALDRFVVAGGDGNNRYRAAYGILCEFSHPNIRGVAGFIREKHEEAIGRQLQYSQAEDIQPNDQLMVFSILAEMMRLGHSAAEFLRLGEVIASGDSYRSLPTEPKDLHRILTKIMLLESDPPVH